MKAIRTVHKPDFKHPWPYVTYAWYEDDQKTIFKEIDMKLNDDGTEAPTE